jgi:hypothetical protein
MKVYVNHISGIDDAITSMYMSKRTWTRELEENIRQTCHGILDWQGKMRDNFDEFITAKQVSDFEKWMDSLTKWSRKHITMLRYIDISVTVNGLHRGGQDDWDSHAKRFDNRIIRASTRLATFGNEMSDFYKGKIIPTDEVIKELELIIPNEIIHNGYTYIKTTNGFIREDLKDDKDVKRGLYMMSIPSDFIFKINLTEFGHVYKERNNDSTANPEVKECCESIADQIEKFNRWFTRELLMAIKN